MRRSPTGLSSVGLMLVSVLAVAGCETDSVESSPATTVSVPTPTEAETGSQASAQEAPTDATSEVAAETTPDAQDVTTSETVAAPTSEDAPAPTSEDAAAPTTADSAPAVEAEAEDVEAGPPIAADLVVVQESTVFTTPAQAAFCTLSAPAGGRGAAVTCEVAQSSVPPGDELMGLCPSEGYGWYFNFFEDTGHGGFSCNHHDGIVHLPGVDLTDDPWVDQSLVHVLPGGTRVPILDYGRVLQAGNFSCSVQPEGLTCSGSATGRGFTVNSASYVSW